MRVCLFIDGPADGRIVPLLDDSNAVVVEDVKYKPFELSLGGEIRWLLIPIEMGGRSIVFTHAEILERLIDQYSAYRHYVDSRGAA